MGRTPKLTPAVQDLIIEVLEVGLPDYMAFGRAGISKGSFYGWLDRGKKAKEAKPVDEREERYINFLDEVTRARERAEPDLAIEWIKIAKEQRDWRAYRDYLARRFPERWSATNKVEISDLSELANVLRMEPDELDRWIGTLVDQEAAEDDGPWTHS